MSWRNPNSYGFAAFVAIVIHLAVAGLFLIEWPDSKPHIVEPVPQHVMANVVQEENKAVKERKRKAELEKKRQQRAAKKRAEKERKRKLEARRKKEKARQEKLRKEKLAKQKAAAEKKRQADAQRAAEKKAADAKAAAEQAERLRQEQLQQEQDMLEQMAQEQAEAELQAQKEAEARAERAAVMTSEHTLLIKEQIQSQWRYPPAVDSGMEVELKLTLVPTGEVVQVQIVKSSGNPALDRSVEQAIRKASPLPVPKNIAVFEQNFRSFTMKFRPENASW